MSATIFNTITGDDWRRMFAAHRARGRFEGNSLLAQIRAVAAKKNLLQRGETVSRQPHKLEGAGSIPAAAPSFPDATATKSLQPKPAHADNQPECKVIAPGISFAGVSSVAPKRSGVHDHAEAGAGDSFSGDAPLGEALFAIGLAGIAPGFDSQNGSESHARRPRHDLHLSESKTRPICAGPTGDGATFPKS